MKFPLIDGKNMYWRPPFNKKGQCSLCGQKTPKDKENVFIAVNGGALSGTKDNATIDSNLIGFLSINLHDHDKKSLGYLNIVDSSQNGQFEFYFCSVKCLREFFNQIVDAFEKTLK